MLSDVWGTEWISPCPYVICPIAHLRESVQFQWRVSAVDFKDMSPYTAMAKQVENAGTAKSATHPMYLTLIPYKL